MATRGRPDPLTIFSDWYLEMFNDFHGLWEQRLSAQQRDVADWPQAWYSFILDMVQIAFTWRDEGRITLRGERSDLERMIKAMNALTEGPKDQRLDPSKEIFEFFVPQFVFAGIYDEFIVATWQQFIRDLDFILTH